MRESLTQVGPSPHALRDSAWLCVAEIGASFGSVTARNVLRRNMIWLCDASSAATVLRVVLMPGSVRVGVVLRIIALSVVARCRLRL